MNLNFFYSFKNSSRSEVFLSFLLSFIFLVSCVQRKQEEPPVAPAQQKENQPAPSEPLSLCDILKSHFSESQSQLAAPLRTEPIERQFQRVLRHDCAGNIQSDKIETVQSPHLSLNLKNLSQKPFKAAFVFNERTCANILSTMPVVNWPLIGKLYAVTGDGVKKISIKGDLASASLTFKLAVGSNNLFVRYFHDCMPSNIESNNVVTIGTSNCENSKEFTTIVYPINITYTEKTLSGSITIDPTPESCANEAK